mmetsp:Transcript_16190/g.34158  ORF Transcript_16190/g.34158 Transcript_16190/m.34158 type:complete len:269 (-) Transcript_16190:564-1370(-)
MSLLKRATARSKSSATSTTAATNVTPTPSAFHSTDLQSNVPQNDELVIERVRLKIPNAHVFKLPPKPSSGGWRGADWRDKIWQGTLKVVERGEETAVLLVDSSEERNIFAVCPIRHNVDGRNTNVGNGVDRCIDSSRYFVLRIQNAQGRHMFIGLAFNERNDAFDFNTALEDSRREKEVEKRAALGISSVKTGVDYRMKEGETIRVSIPKVNSVGSGDDNSPSNGNNGEQLSAAARRREARKARQGSSNSGGGGFLKPSSKDTPSRLA